MSAKFNLRDEVKVVAGKDADTKLVKNKVAVITEIREPCNLHGKEFSYVLQFPNETKFMYLNFPESELEFVAKGKPEAAKKKTVKSKKEAK